MYKRELGSLYRQRAALLKLLRWSVVIDLAAPAVGAAITTCIFWGAWWLVLGFLALHSLLAWVLVSEDLRDIRREQRWQRWVDEHTTIRNDFPKD